MRSFPPGNAAGQGGRSTRQGGKQGLTCSTSTGPRASASNGASSLAFFVTAQSSLLVGDHRESLLLLLTPKAVVPQAYNCRAAVHVQFEVQSVPCRYYLLAVLQGYG